jgi:hypothetical protein
MQLQGLSHQNHLNLNQESYSYANQKLLVKEEEYTFSRRLMK